MRRSLGRADDPADLRLDVVARRDRELDREARRDPQLVDRVHVPRIRNGHVQDTACKRVRDRIDALEHVDRHLRRGVRIDTCFGEVDQRELVARRKRARDAFLGRDAFRDERLRERSARAGAAARHRQLVFRDQTGGGEQVREELGHRIDARNVATAELTALDGRRLVADAWRGPQGVVVAHIPRSRYRQKLPGP